MESSPLVLAQTYARKAAKANAPAAAIDGHDQAAGQFAKAAKDTSSSEAFRTLKLLEEHHKKLSQLVQIRSKQPDTPKAAKASTSESNSSSHNPSRASSSSGASPAEKPSRPSDAPTSTASHRPQREISSSIASNLASARGIPTNRQRRSGQAPSPILNQQNAEGKIVSPPRRSRLVDPPSRTLQDVQVSEKPASRSVSVPTSMPKGTSKEPEQLPSASKTEDTFNRFYSTFETIFSKLSAPLAFAGLPLNPESDAVGTLDSISQQSTQSKATSTRPKPHTRATASPEYSRLFSPAALRALREDAGTAGLNTTESFYVVPTTGGALPYASILARQTASRHQKQHSRATTAGGVDADLSDEFVDARETPGNSPEISLKQKRVRGSGTGVKTASGKTLEELELENTGLRSICDELSRRLWQFEVSSQMSHGALHQSLRAGINVSPAASNTGDRGMGVARGTVGGVAGEATGGRVDTIYTEARLQKAENEMEDLRLENEKLRRYREKWERLTVKAKARQRRESSMAVDKVEMEDGD